jgi:hypothetical protein
VEPLVQSFTLLGVLLALALGLLVAAAQLVPQERRFGERQVEGLLQAFEPRLHSTVLSSRPALLSNLLGNLRSSAQHLLSSLHSSVLSTARPLLGTVGQVDEDPPLTVGVVGQLAALHAPPDRVNADAERHSRLCQQHICHAVHLPSTSFSTVPSNLPSTAGARG